MTHKPLDKCPLVYVEWLDHNGGSDGWFDIDDRDAVLSKVRTIGWLLHEEDDSILVASTTSIGNETREQYTCEMVIAKALIIGRIKRLPNPKR